MRTRSLAAFTLFLYAAILVSAMAIALGMGGCTRVGAALEMDDSGRPRAENPSPVTLTIEDADKKGFANGTGPARFTSITEGEVQTMQTGTTPRDLWLKLPNGAQLNLSSGTDINIEGAEFDAATGGFKFAKFGTVASEPLRAHNEGLVAWTSYMNHLASMSVEARKAELDAIKAVSEAAFTAVVEGLKMTAGVP